LNGGWSSTSIAQGCGDASIDPRDEFSWNAGSAFTSPSRGNVCRTAPVNISAPCVRGFALDPHIVLFLEHLQRAIPGKLLVIWDGLSAHRSQFVRDYIAGLNGHILTERLPAYAPELNPVEYIWAHLKQHELPNVCAKDLWHLGDRARHHLKRMRRRPKLIRAFWKQSALVF
jgi:transposase